MFKIIYKKYGDSSFKAINEYKRNNNISKIGHTGTLDPLAQGLLMIATDDDTRLIPYICNKDKEYVVEATLGFISKTYDSEGPIEKYSDYVPSKEEVVKTINEFIGTQKQTPPLFSAKKIDGVRAYELARSNKEVKLKSNTITIYEINDIEYQYPKLKFRTLVSNGTYIRSLIHDIGVKLKTGAYINYLERTKIHGLSENDYIDYEKILNLKLIEIKSKNELKSWFEGKCKKINIEDAKYLLKFNNNIVGVVEIENNNLIKSNLFGKTIQNILNNKE